MKKTLLITAALAMFSFAAHAETLSWEMNPDFSAMPVSKQTAVTDTIIYKWAHVMQQVYGYGSDVRRQPQYPQMSWGSNYRLSGNAIMWSLFWCGALFTPDHRVEGENIQHYLQRHYLGSMEAIAARVADMPHVLGFDTLNEPGTGWVGDGLSYRHLAPSEENRTRPRPGVAASALDGLAAASGLSVEVPVLRRNLDTGHAEPAGSRIINPDGVSRNSSAPATAAASLSPKMASARCSTRSRKRRGGTIPTGRCSPSSTRSAQHRDARSPK